MLDVRFFQNPRFSAASATITLTFFALFGSMFLLTQYFQFVLGYSPLEAGLHDRAGRDRDDGRARRKRRSSCERVRHQARRGRRAVDRRGRAVRCTRRTRSCRRSCSAAPCALLFGVGMGLTMAPATESIMGSLPPGKAGVGSAVNDTTRQIGGALGVAVIGSIFALRYHATVETIVGVPAAVQTEVRDSIGNVLLAAEPAAGRAATTRARCWPPTPGTSPACASPSPSPPR